jgi:hypothetical protein
VKGAWRASLVASAIACSRDAPPPRAPLADPVPWRYEVALRGRDLQVEARFAPGVAGEPRVDDDAAPYVRDLATSVEGGTRVFRYRFALRDAAEQRMDVGTALASGDVVVAPPSTWLLHPDEPTPGSFRLRVTTEPPDRFVAGTRPSSDGAPNTYEAATTDLDASSFAVFGGFHERTIMSGPSRVIVAVAPHDLGLSDDQVVAWTQAAVSGIAAYLGRAFPSPRTLVVVERGLRGVPTGGQTLGDGGPAVLVRAGDELAAPTTRDDWVMTHELLHVVMPRLAYQHTWLAEGISSYVEPIVRVRAGTLAPEKLWRELVEGLPQGLPVAGDEGLEKTHTWGRTYWGGSLFCLLVDVAIRERTRNARSFDDVMRGVVATGADVEDHWEVERFLDVGDAATGTRALHELFGELALAPGAVDLAALWRRLGVKVEGERVTFDDAAPLASVRRGIAGR